MNKTVVSFFLFVLLCFNDQLMAQPFTHADTLRGSYSAARAWWDVLKYDLHVKFNITDSTISGYNQIQYKKKFGGEINIMQIDLKEPLVADSFNFQYQEAGKNIACSFKRDGSAYFVMLPLKKSFTKNYRSEKNYLTVYYHGKPMIAKRPPWDGGLIWKKDSSNNPWVSIACQGTGASAWYPCKDHQADEPDSAEMHITIPDSLVCVGNGRFRRKIDNNDGTATYDWAVVNPINNYNLIPYIGKYVHFNEIYKGEKGNLDMDYWVLDYNLDKAKEHFKDAPKMMKAFEYWFGPYPFYEDGYKLVESPHLGMEHQSATAYGNKYLNGYLGRDLSESGWGLQWDYIIVHESGHEWFANNISTKDIADMWVHEGFTTYSEVLFTEYYYGKKAADEYIMGIRKRIKNKNPVIGQYNVNNAGNGDMYPKGANLLHTIRQIINNDSLFRNILRGLNKTFYHQTVTSKQVETYISQQSNIDFRKIFNQYLRTIQVPVLEYKVKKHSITYRYANCDTDFTMPLKIFIRGERWITPTTNWQTLRLNSKEGNGFSVDTNFYLNTKKLD